MKRGTSALIAASSRTVCVSTITSRNPCSADTTQDAHEHAGVTWEALLKSTLAIVTPSSCSRSSLSRAVPWRTSALTLVPRSSKARTMRPPRLPVAPATTMVESFMIPILEKGQRRCKVGAMFIAGYYAWRSDHLHLIPKLEIAQIVLTPTPTDQQIPLIVVHIIPKCLTDAPVEGCKGYLLRVLRWSEDTKDWAPTEIDEPLDLLWSIHDDDLPRTLHPGIEKRFNLCWINQSHQVLLLGRVPLRWQEVFNQTDQFRFDVRITAKNCPPVDASIGVRISDDWKSPSVQKLRVTNCRIFLHPKHNRISLSVASKRGAARRKPMSLVAPLLWCWSRFFSLLTSISLDNRLRRFSDLRPWQQ